MKKYRNVLLISRLLLKEKRLSIKKTEQIFQSLSDEELVKLCMSDNRLAQQAIYQRYSHAMMGVCSRYAKSKEDAKDVFQDGFIKVFTKLETFKGESMLATWMTKIFVNTALTFLRKGINKYSFLDIDEVFDLVDEDDEISFDTDEITFMDNLTAEEAMRLVQFLPDKYRLIINMYCLDGYNHKQIADALQISEGTSKSQLSRARKMLITMIQKKTKINDRDFAKQS